MSWVSYGAGLGPQWSDSDPPWLTTRQWVANFPFSNPTWYDGGAIDQIVGTQFTCSGDPNHWAQEDFSVSDDFALASAWADVVAEIEAAKPSVDFTTQINFVQIYIQGFGTMYGGALSVGVCSGASGPRAFPTLPPSFGVGYGLRHSSDGFDYADAVWGTPDSSLTPYKRFEPESPDFVDGSGYLIDDRGRDALVMRPGSPHTWAGQDGANEANESVWTPDEIEDLTLEWLFEGHATKVQLWQIGNFIVQYQYLAPPSTPAAPVICFI